MYISPRDRNIMLVLAVGIALATAYLMFDMYAYADVYIVGDTDTYAKVSVVYPDGRKFTTDNITDGGPHRRVPVWELDDVIIEVGGEPEWLAIQVVSRDGKDHFLSVIYPPGAAERFARRDNISVATYDWD